MAIVIILVRRSICCRLLAHDTERIGTVHWLHGGVFGRRFVCRCSSSLPIPHVLNRFLSETLDAVRYSIPHLRRVEWYNGRGRAPLGLSYVTTVQLARLMELVTVNFPPKLSQHIVGGGFIFRAARWVPVMVQASLTAIIIASAMSVACVVLPARTARLHGNW